jgi:glucokinase
MIVGGIDIGGTKVSIGLVNDSGNLLCKQEWPTDAHSGLKVAIDRIGSGLDELCRESGLKMDGIGIGCTGPVDPISGKLEVNTFLPGWEGLGLMEGLSQRYSLSIAMENDADAAVLAEGCWGTGKLANTFLYITISTGIGGGLLLHHKLFRGVKGAHPEVGHHVIDPSGPACFCGANGCWEVMASGPALARWYRDHLPDGVDGNPMDAREICHRAQIGEPLALEAVNRTASYLGIGLANMITIFTPDLISLGGGLMNSWSLFEPIVRDTIKKSCGLVPFSETNIGRASLGKYTGLLGAAQAWYHRFLG